MQQQQPIKEQCEEVTSSLIGSMMILVDTDPETNETLETCDTDSY